MKLNKQPQNLDMPNTTGASKSNNYAVLGVRGTQALETQLNQYNDIGYKLFDIISASGTGDIECILYAEVSPNRPANTTGSAVSTKYKVIDPAGVEAMKNLLNAHHDAGYKLVKAVKVGASTLLVLER